MNELHVGLAVLGVPLLLIGLIFLRRYRLLALIYLLAVVIGLGYLTTTGAVEDVGKEALTYINGTEPASEPAAPESAPAETPPAAPEPTPAPTTTPEPTTPEPAPSTEPAPDTTTPSEPTTPSPTPPSDGTTTPAPSPAP